MCQTFGPLTFQIVLSLVMNRFLFACTLGACVSVGIAPTARAATNVSLSIGDVRMTEPPSSPSETPSGQKSMVFPVTLSSPWSEDVRISYATSVGPNATTADSSTLAQPGFDFSSRQGQITIPAGTTGGRIEVPILADGEVEEDETFVVTLSNVESSDNSGHTVTVARSVAKGTIIEAVKGIVLGGKVLAYNVSPSAFGYDPTTGTFVDTFDKPAKAQGQSDVTVIVSNGTTSRIATTDSKGNYSLLVLPGTYTVQLQDFQKSDPSGNAQNYSLPARKVRLARDSRANNFVFYGVAGTAGYTFPGYKGVFPAYIQVEARPVGASPSSTPVAVGISQYYFYDPTRAATVYRFFLGGLPEGKYNLTVNSVNNGENYYFTNVNYPSFTVSLPDLRSVNSPDARIAIIGTYRAPGSSSAGGS